MIATDASPFVPPAPLPQRAMPGTFGLYRHLRTNPLGIWTGGQVIEPLQRVTLRSRHDIEVEVQERA